MSLRKILLTIVIWVSILESTEVVHNGHDSAMGGPPIFFPAQSPPHHLHVAHRAEDLAGNEHHVSFWRIKSSGEQTVVTQHTDIPVLKSVQKVTP